MIKRLPLCWLLPTILALSGAANAAPKTPPAKATVTGPTAQVKITFVEMAQSDVRSLAVMPPAPGRARDDLKNLKSAANRRHVSYHITPGPTVSVSTGQEKTEGIANVLAMNVRGSRAYLRVRIVNPPDERRQPTRMVAATRTFRSGETRLIAALSAPKGLYRYTFATVTVKP